MQKFCVLLVGDTLIDVIHSNFSNGCICTSFIDCKYLRFRQCHNTVNTIEGRNSHCKPDDETPSFVSDICSKHFLTNQKIFPYNCTFSLIVSITFRLCMSENRTCTLV